MKKLGKISTDKIIAMGLIISCNIYAVASIVLGAPPSGELLGTLFGGILGALGRWAPAAKNEQEPATEKEAAKTAAGAKNALEAAEHAEGIFKK